MDFEIRTNAKKYQMNRTYTQTYLLILKNFTKIYTRWPKLAGEKHGKEEIMFSLPAEMEPEVDKVFRFAVSQGALIRRTLPQRTLTQEEFSSILVGVAKKIYGNPMFNEQAKQPGIFLAMPEINRFK